MKTILKFSEEEEQGVLRAIKSLDMAIVLFEIQNNLKKECEYVIDEWKEDKNVYDVLELVFEKIQNLYYENGIIIEDLIE